MINSRKIWTVAFDYGQLEARLIGMASKDRVFADQIIDDYDIHRGMSIRFIKKYPPLVGLSDYSEITEPLLKGFRGKSKNKIVFPWIYDDSPKNTARYLNMPEVLTKGLYDEFWEEYWEMLQWKDSVHKNYFKKGYVSTLMGSRRHGPLNFTKRVNSIIQGTGGYVNMAAMNRLSRAAYDLKKPQYQGRLNIHDDLTFGLPDETLKEDISFIAKEMCRKTYDWMWIIPLQVEVQLGENWAEIEEVAVFDTRDFDYGEKVA